MSSLRNAVQSGGHDGDDCMYAAARPSAFRDWIATTTLTVYPLLIYSCEQLTMTNIVWAAIFVMLPYCMWQLLRPNFPIQQAERSARGRHA